MAASRQAAQFQGYCSHCAKWAHKRAECRTQLAQMKGRQLLEFKIPSRKVKVSSRRIGALPKTMKWRSMRRVGVFWAVTTPRGPAGTLLVDGTADDHICHPEFAKESSPSKRAGLTLRDVQGNTLFHHGTRPVKPTVTTQGSEQTLTSRLQTSGKTFSAWVNFKGMDLRSR